MRNIEAKKVRFMTLPFDRYETVPTAGSVNIIAAERARSSVGRRRQRDTGRAPTSRQYPDDELPRPRRDVS